MVSVRYTVQLRRFVKRYFTLNVSVVLDDTPLREAT
jgi:hypothetical protein